MRSFRPAPTPIRLASKRASGSARSAMKDEPSLAAFLTEPARASRRLRNLEIAPYLRFAFGSRARAICRNSARSIGRSALGKLAFETRQASAQLGAARRLQGAARHLRTRHASRAMSSPRCIEAAREARGAITDRRPCGLQATVVQELFLSRPRSPPGLPPSLAVASAPRRSSSCASARKAASGSSAREGGWDRPNAALRASRAVARENAGWFNPLLEIASMRHERAQERLFIS